MGSNGLKKSADNLICISINEVAENECKGIMYNRYSENGIVFNQLDQIIILIEEVLDSLQSPRASTRSRSFTKNSELINKISINKDKMLWSWEEFEKNAGLLATFYIFVKYRQNSTWQGEVYWKEMDKSVDFFSELEMIKIIDAAIGSI